MVKEIFEKLNWNWKINVQNFSENICGLTNGIGHSQKYNLWNKGGKVFMQYVSCYWNLWLINYWFFEFKWVNFGNIQKLEFKKKGSDINSIWNINFQSIEISYWGDNFRVYQWRKTVTSMKSAKIMAKRPWRFRMAARTMVANSTFRL